MSNQPCDEHRVELNRPPGFREFFREMLKDILEFQQPDATLRILLTRHNYKSKSSVIEAICTGDKVEVFDPESDDDPDDGEATLVGPHPPAEKKWQIRVSIEWGRAVFYYDPVYY